MKKISLLTICVFLILSIYTTRSYADSLEALYPVYGVNRYNSIYRDESGLVWLGTERGLFVYDGYETVHIKSGEVKNIISIETSKICIMFSETICLYDIVEEHFIQTSLDKADLGNCRSMVYKDRIVYASTDKQGLIAYDIEKDNWKVLFYDMNDAIHSISLVENKIYVGGTRKLRLYDINSSEITNLDLPDMETVNRILWDKNRKCLWVGNIGSLYQYFPISKTYVKVNIPENSIKCMLLDDNNNLLLGTDSGLIIYKPEIPEIQVIEHDAQYQHGLSSNIIWDIYQDDSHNIWLGTDFGITIMHYTPYYKEVSILEFAKNLALDNKQGNYISHIYQDRFGDIWLGGRNGVIHKINDERGDWFNKGNPPYDLPHSRIRQIKEDKDGELWLCTDGGLLLYDRKKNQFDYLNLIDKGSGKSINYVYDIWDDSHGLLWIMLYNGEIVVLDKRKINPNKKEPYVVVPVDEYIKGVYEASKCKDRQLIEDNQGNAWVSRVDGLLCIEKNSRMVIFIPISSSQDEGNNGISNLILGEDGLLWFSYLDRIGYINPITKEYKISPTSLFDAKDIIKDMVYYAGNLWIESVYKTIVFNTNTKESKELFLPPNDYSVVFYDKKKDQIVFGGNDVLLYVKPDIMFDKTRVYPTRVVSINSEGNRLQQGTDYWVKNYNGINYNIFPPTFTQFNIEISSFKFLQSKRIGYEYQLGDISDKWSPVGIGNNKISLMNLTPGKYKLKLRSSVDMDLISVYYFEIMTPWYLSNWAYSFYVLLAMIFLGGIIQYFFNKNKRKYERMEREKLLEVSNLKMDFFTNMSHELKTPLSLVIAPLERLYSEIKGTKYEFTVNLIYNNAQRLNKLIQRILDFKQMEYMDHETMIYSKVGLNQLIQVVCKSFSNILKEKEITLELSLYKEEIWLDIDLLKIESVLYNLLSNAVKFVPKKDGRIIVKSDKDEETSNVRLSISDNGTGIDEQEQKLIWLRLYQGKNNKDNAKGVGIGLYLVKKFVSMHGGEITVDSKVGKGTTFEITLPLSKKEEVGIKELATQETVQKSTMLPKILVVDDNEEILSFLTNIDSDKYEYLKATDGKKGLEIALQEIPDLIIVDEMMPEMSGLEMCRLIRKDKRITSVPIIMLTAKDDKETELSSIKTGIDVFIPKPFEVSQLILRMEQLLQSRKELREQVKLHVMMDQTAEVKKEVLSGDERLMKEIFQIIEDRLSDSAFNVSSLCEELGISQKQLLRTLKKQTGETPVSFIRKIRLKKAALLIQQHKFTISEIMFMVGFSHPSYFTKCFVEEYKMTPKEYEESYTAGKDN